jgi:hypothetical protein
VSRLPGLLAGDKPRGSRRRPPCVAVIVGHRGAFFQLSEAGDEIRKKLTKNSIDVNRASQDLRQSRSTQVDLKKKRGVFGRLGGHYIFMVLTLIAGGDTLEPGVGNRLRRCSASVTPIGFSDFGRSPPSKLSGKRHRISEALGRKSHRFDVFGIADVSERVAQLVVAIHP